MTNLLRIPGQSRVQSLLAIGVASLALGGATRAQNGAGEGGAMVHGTNFQMRTVLDESLCVEHNAAASSVPQLYLARCTGLANQRWAFTDGRDGANVVINNVGMCWTAAAHGPREEVLHVETCDYHVEQRFILTAAGLIKLKGSDDCLTVDFPVVGAPVLIADCANPAVRGQYWRLVT